METEWKDTDVCIGEVVDTFTEAEIQRVQDVIERSRSRHPETATCQCAAIDALRMALTVLKEKEEADSDD